MKIIIIGGKKGCVIEWRGVFKGKKNDSTVIPKLVSIVLMVYSKYLTRDQSGAGKKSLGYLLVYIIICISNIFL